ncbi:HigA family addiction module antitoxin [Pasteurella skyensis]|uniref:HigA family addiction module antitoxin n=1 Tax=Phocoenobacter skyensis TaxID=97481 RepID=A0AAJ6NZY2_9PAST|nr:HigA family addiction module antitoxin [Pasteurella skyensis]MDP8161941.1 HigA family addiction module antitoxin [Pasteurella skyensis]MDP8170282.1 HigA family addiction module antitoxin [Pasteurella skyensis]MDP8172097.1 HigA family addiction module antitoxin [Pasteurella skyensis]MDP8176555.1 HigA family addiction module antitoxin [Pasteurella skyensis]MDP8178443.1 HigA family addiction module antitoxin [Pasteurella skyensis]
MRATRKPTSVGEILFYEYLEPLNLKISDLAKILNIHRNTAGALVNGKARLSLEMALRLSKAFNTSPDFWISIQTKSDLWELENDVKFQESLTQIIPPNIYQPPNTVYTP